jgi:predicted Zn-dependent protease
MKHRASIFVVALLTLASCRTPDPVTGKRVYNIYSLEDDIKLGQQTLVANTQEMQKQGAAVNRDQAKLREIQDIVARIGAVSDLPQLPYNVTLYQSDIVNAAAAPGGSMMVFSGLYDPQKGLVRDSEELAAVLGHEIAHVNCRHTTETMSKVNTTATFGEILATIATRRRGEVAGDAVRNVFSVGTALWIPNYTREQEAEADRVGLFYMAKAGYDPRAAPRIWQRAAQGDKSNRSSIFATHPSDAARYQALSKLIPKAMETYKTAVGHYPPGYVPGSFQ